MVILCDCILRYIYVILIIQTGNIYHATMSESTNPIPFVCKWLDAHSKSQYFETVKELRKHVAKHVMLEGIKNLSSIFWLCDTVKINRLLPYLTEHLRKHIH
jgi:hypothetical protein